MKNIKKFITMMLMSASVLFFACDKDEESTLSPAEAKTKITQLATDVGARMEEMQDAEGLEVMGVLSNLKDPFTTTKSTAKSPIFSTISKYLMPINPKNKSTLGEPAFDFAGNVGIYTFTNDPPYYWTKEASDKIIIKFPSDTTKWEVNDAVITINSYTEVLIGHDYMPTGINANITVKDIKIVDIDLTAAWDDEGEPTSLGLDVYLFPFDFDVNFSNANKAVSIDVAIKYKDAQFFSAGVGATFETSSMDSLPININGYIQFFKVKFQANVDIKDLMTVFENFATYTSEDALLAAINKEIAAAVYVSGAKAADIQLAYNTTPGAKDPVDIVFVYSDGTKESALPYFKEIGEEMEDFFGSLEEYYGEW